jgi:fluoride exporter
LPVSVDPDLPPSGHPSLTATAAVALGGAAGAVARTGLATLWPAQHGSWDWATLVANLSGATAIAVVLVLLGAGGARGGVARHARPFLVTGVLGGYTTYSTFAVDVAEMSRDGRSWLAVSYALVTIVGIVAVCWAALVGARRLVEQPPTGEPG